MSTVTSPVVLILMACTVFLFAIVIIACQRIQRLEDQLWENANEDHAKCMSMVAAFVGDEFAARVLMTAADDYDTAEGQSNLIRMRNTVWVKDGPSMPSLWLRDRAETILAKTHAEA